MGRVIAIANQKGGVGKTTTTVNLAVCLSELGKRVLVIDMDPQGSSTTCYGVNKGLVMQTLSDVFLGNCSASKAILTLDKYHVDLIPSSTDLNAIEQYLGKQEDIYEVMQHKMKEIKRQYDYIFLDCSPTMGLVTMNGLYFADSILIPVQCQFLAIDGLTQLCNTIKAVQKNKKAKKRQFFIEGVVMTMLDKRSKEGWKVVSEVKQYFEDKVMDTIITTGVVCQSAPRIGIPVVKYKPRSVTSLQYHKLAKEILEKEAKEI